MSEMKKTWCPECGHKIVIPPTPNETDALTTITFQCDECDSSVVAVIY